jgi:hypothetical protein
MDPRTRTPPVLEGPPAEPAQTPEHQRLDKELDRELDDTFPASDPVPWSHEVK